jgi:Tol biopolymer transport system component
MDRRQLILATGASGTAGVLGLATTPALVSRACVAPGEATLHGTLRQLTEPGNADNRATYMPDGKTVLFASKRSGRSQIWTIDAKGGSARRLLASSANDYGRVAPSPDARQICFSTDRWGMNAICVSDLGTGRVVRISDLAFWSFGPTWSVRNRIAFFSQKGGNTLNIWTVRPDGSDPRQVTDRPGESRQPWWSPDGNTLAISANGGAGEYQLWLLAADGSQARQITSRGTYEQPFWSPDGRRIAISAKIDDAHHRIYVIGTDGLAPQPIVQPEGIDNVHPCWSADGTSIVFTSGKGNDSCLYVCDLA